MPFIGKDWRSPGEAWVKTESLGWQRMKIIESQLHPNCHHQDHPACSWPPRAQFGQHMAKNCANIESCDSNTTTTNNNTTTLKRTIGHQDSCSSSGCGRGGSCSPDHSCTSSASSSPTGSPEKTATSTSNGHSPLSSASTAPHHLHPITISSPYGQYTCCAHHHNADYSMQSPCSSPRSSTIVTANRRPSSYHYDEHQQNLSVGDSSEMIKSKSLSRESIQQQQQQISGSRPDSGCNRKVLRHNNSCSDFREHQDSNKTTTTVCDDANEQAAMNLDHDELNGSMNDMPNDENVSPQNTPPILMRNGFRISSDDDGDHVDDGQRQHRIDAEQQSESTVDKSRHDDNVVKQQTTPSLNNQNSTGGSCCCCCSCCCCGSSSSSQQQHNCLQNPRTAPHCRISVRTREVAMYNTISEAFYRLDFCNAIHDIRRFNYICKLLHLLITQNLTSLSGCATKVLFTMLEQVAWEVSSNKRNIHVLKNLLAELKQMIQKYYCWGRPIGSSLLWQQHFDTIERISQIVDGIELSPPKTSNDDPNQITFDKLPVEMIREILLRLNDYRDLVNSAQATPLMRTMIDSQYIWQKLCHYHFTDQQLRLVLKSNELLTSRSGNSISSSNRQTLRGIKYARTTSADGQSSFRNPVKRQQQRVAQQQQQQSATAANTRQNQASRQTASSRRGSSSSASSTSYVTKAIRIFDRGSSMPETATTTAAPARPNNEAHKSSKNGGGRNDVSNQEQRTATKTTTSTANQQRILRNESTTSSSVHQSSASSTAAAANNRIDWEHVFHQLRKRYDLKEEYADCLLLCRHCRCLFWKSFGHPCIKGSESVFVGSENSNNRNDKYFQLQPNASESVATTNRPNATCSRCGSDAGGAPSRSVRNESADMNQPSSSSVAKRDNPSVSPPIMMDGALNNQHAAPQQDDGRRRSVASLSRNFDNTHTAAQRNVTQSTITNRQADHLANSFLEPATSASQSHNQNNQQPALATNSQQQQQQRNPLNELNARFQQQRNNNLAAVGAAANMNQPRNGDNNNNSVPIKRELVPQHVTITPQAFLKFFSL